MTRYSILIGCKDYQDTKYFSPLDCTINDVEMFSEQLSDPKVGNFDRVTSFCNGESHTEILEFLELLLKEEVRSYDTVLIYFSGHAAVDESENLHLAVCATKKRTLSSTSIPIRQMISMIGGSRCREVVLILDCCYSGAVRNAFALPADWTGGALSIITSSTEVEESKFKEGERNSIFTKFLLEGLTTGHADLDNNGLITVSEAYQYAHNCVKATGLQTPMEVSIKKGVIEFARNQHYQKIDLSSIEPSELRKFLAIGNMIKLVTERTDSQFMTVVMPHYYIEGEQYGCSGLTVSDHHTPNIRQKATGFECDAFFPPHMLTPHAKNGKEEVNGLIKVRMEIMSENIYVIAGQVADAELHLFT